jgi:hypothetical protein
VGNNFIHVGIAEWHDVILHRLSALSTRTGNPVCTMAVQENRTVPRNIVFMGFGKVFGQVDVYCHPQDREATDTRVMQTGGVLVAVNPLPGAEHVA